MTGPAPRSSRSPCRRSRRGAAAFRARDSSDMGPARGGTGGDGWPEWSRSRLSSCRGGGVDGRDGRPPVDGRAALQRGVGLRRLGTTVCSNSAVVVVGELTVVTGVLEIVLCCRTQNRSHQLLELDANRVAVSSLSEARPRARNIQHGRPARCTTKRAPLAMWDRGGVPLVMVVVRRARLTPNVGITGGHVGEPSRTHVEYDCAPSGGRRFHARPTSTTRVWIPPAGV